MQSDAIKAPSEKRPMKRTHTQFDPGPHSGATQRRTLLFLCGAGVVCRAACYALGGAVETATHGRKDAERESG
jgi:hypothetical protein